MARRARHTGHRAIRAAVVVALAVLVAGGCTHVVALDAPAEPITVDVSLQIQQEITLTAAR